MPGGNYITHIIQFYTKRSTTAQYFWCERLDNLYDMNKIYINNAVPLNIKRKYFIYFSSTKIVLENKQEETEPLKKRIIAIAN